MAPPSSSAAQLERDLDELAQRPDDSELNARLLRHGQDLLPILSAFLIRDLPIRVLERYEELYKDVLRPLLTTQLAPAAARDLARFQLEVGLLLKYKSYAVKASSPLGYSIFLQQPGEGFSFQRHITHKTEVFHILDPQTAGFVFLCSHEAWAAVYEPTRFAAWLAGETADPAYERFRHPARAGDVFVLDTLGVVHTVVGCILEEFATISTDMVERLHDQNVGRPVPAHFGRSWVYQTLATVRSPVRSQRVEGEAAAAVRHDLAAQRIEGGHRTLLAQGFLRAAELTIDPGASSAPFRDEQNAISLFVRSGRGLLGIGSSGELARPTPPTLALAPSDLVTLPRDLAFCLINEGDQPLTLVEHAIDPSVALVAAR